MATRMGPAANDWTIRCCEPHTTLTEALAHFRDLCGDRELYGRVLQCRAGHGFLGEYYKDFVPSENIDCPCREPVQTRPHVSLDCPLCEEHRHILRDAPEDISLAEILGSPKGIDALARFLRKSGAFTKTGHPRVGPHAPRWEDEPDPGEEEWKVEDEQWGEEGEEEEESDGERGGIGQRGEGSNTPSASAHRPHAARTALRLLHRASQQWLQLVGKLRHTWRPPWRTDTKEIIVEVPLNA